MGSYETTACLTCKKKAESDPATSPIVTDAPTSAPRNDDLPPFATLTTDEERERKAECSSPGTYNVVVNPESFQHLPEYSEDLDVKSLRLLPLRRGSLAASMASSQGRDCAADGVHHVDGVRQVDGVHHSDQDANVVILRRFEDATRRATSQWKDSRSPSSPQVTTSSSEVSGPLLDGQVDLDPTKSLMQRAADGGQDSNLLHHFRNHIWRQLAQVEHEGTARGSTHGAKSGVVILEHAARFFPPVSFVAARFNEVVGLSTRVTTTRKIAVTDDPLTSFFMP